MKKQKHKNAGITLIALAITIVVLLILAGITINLTIGEDGIIKRAEEAGKNYVDAAENERLQIGKFFNEMDNIIRGSTNSGRGSYNSEFRNSVIAAIREQGVETLETDSDDVIIGNIRKIYESGITYADSRINTDSASYTKGYAQGKSEGESRLFHNSIIFNVQYFCKL